MMRHHKPAWMWSAGIAFALGLVSGCQTYQPETGLTLPSPNYLKHPPQYIPPSPPFPLPRELATLEEAQRAQQEGQRLPVRPVP